MLRVKNISKSYGRKKVLREVSFELTEGLYGFLGANGAGKSTLFDLISGYITQYSGQIDYPEVDRSHQVLIGVLPQQFQGYGEMTAEEFMTYMGKVKLPTASDVMIRRDLDEKFEIFGLKEKRKNKLKHLSGGQLRRLGISQAFQFNPKIVLLDEPTAGLDPAERVNFKNYISECSANEIILLSTHIVTDLENITKKIFIINHGKLAEQGTQEKLIESVKGHVWLIHSETEEDIRRKSDGWIISSIYESRGKVFARIITNGDQPCEGAEMVMANLNDVYLSVFNGEGL